MVEFFNTEELNLFHRLIRKKGKNINSIRELSDCEIKKYKLHDVKEYNLSDFGIKTKPKNKKSNPVKKYKNIPLHSMFLYTTEDDFIHPYIIKHWNALDSLSGKFCDIHPTITQLNSTENAYDFIDNFDAVKFTQSNIISKLPGMIFWNIYGFSAFISFEDVHSEKELTKIIRIIFQDIRLKPTIETIMNLSKKKQIITPHKKEEHNLIKDIWPFLIIFVVIIGTIALISKIINPFLLGIVLISTIILFILLGSFMFRHRNQLSESNFKNIITLLVTQLPLLRRQKPKDE